MTRERIARAVLHVYPDTVRRSRGQEMLATLLDSSDGSGRAFIGELLSLLRAGVRSRSQVTAESRLGRLVADGFCLAAILWMASVVSTPPGRWQVWMLAVPITAALVGYDRVAGLVGLTCLGLVNVPASRAARPAGYHDQVVAVVNAPLTLVSANVWPNPIHARYT